MFAYIPSNVERGSQGVRRNRLDVGAIILYRTNHDGQVQLTALIRPLCSALGSHKR